MSALTSIYSKSVLRLLALKPVLKISTAGVIKGFDKDLHYF